jgi:hypothetical protein
MLPTTMNRCSETPQTPCTIHQHDVPLRAEQSTRPRHSSSKPPSLTCSSHPTALNAPGVTCQLRLKATKYCFLWWWSLFYIICSAWYAVSDK